MCNEIWAEDANGEIVSSDFVCPSDSATAPPVITNAMVARAFKRITAVRGLPPLLRSWLGLGAWVAGHAIPDPAIRQLSPT